MKRSKKIAVTGGIGSGKSLFCGFLKNLGCVVYSCDEIYSEVISEESLLSRLKNIFPDCFLNEKLDRRLLAERVFYDDKDRLALDRATHPIIMRRLLEKMESHEISFAEVPLLYEGGFEIHFDKVIALIRKKEERIAAVKMRSKLSEEQILKRMRSQFDPAELYGKNCIIVDNHGSEEDLKEKAEKLVETLLGEKYE